MLVSSHNPLCLQSVLNAVSVTHTLFVDRSNYNNLTLYVTFTHQ